MKQVRAGSKFDSATSRRLAKERKTGTLSPESYMETLFEFRVCDTPLISVMSTASTYVYSMGADREGATGRRL